MFSLLYVDEKEKYKMWWWNGNLLHFCKSKNWKEQQKKKRKRVRIAAPILIGWPKTAISPLWPILKKKTKKWKRKREGWWGEKERKTQSHVWTFD